MGVDGFWALQGMFVAPKHMVEGDFNGMCSELSARCLRGWTSPFSQLSAGMHIGICIDHAWRCVGTLSHTQGTIAQTPHQADRTATPCRWKTHITSGTTSTSTARTRSTHPTRRYTRCMSTGSWSECQHADQEGRAATERRAAAARFGSGGRHDGGRRGEVQASAAAAAVKLALRVAVA